MFRAELYGLRDLLGRRRHHDTGGACALPHNVHGKEFEIFFGSKKLVTSDDLCKRVEVRIHGDKLIVMIETIGVWGIQTGSASFLQSKAPNTTLSSPPLAKRG